MVASLTGHTNRVLYLAMSPDGETIVTGAGDETLRFWNAFPSKKEREKSGGMIGAGTAGGMGGAGASGSSVGSVVGEWCSKGRDSALDYGRLIR